MTYRQFVYVYDNSIEARNRINQWLKDHPPPPEIQPLRWACHKFLEGQIVKDAVQSHKDASDPDRFRVPKSAILEEARGRAAKGEDAGAAFNKLQEKRYPKNMQLPEKRPEV